MKEVSKASFVLCNGDGDNFLVSWVFSCYGAWCLDTKNHPAFRLSFVQVNGQPMDLDVSSSSNHPSNGLMPSECLKHGANLASVHNNKENIFLQNLIKQAAGSPTKTWLGGHDCVAEGKWLWKDGSKMSFQDWAKGQPDNYKSEHCLEMNFGGSFKWNDTSCTVRRPFVCALK
ncbi:hypothetical protein AOLI_G00065020 [Acnodon oligacanthus]